MYYALSRYQLPIKYYFSAFCMWLLFLKPVTHHRNILMANRSLCDNNVHSVLIPSITSLTSFASRQ